MPSTFHATLMKLKYALHSKVYICILDASSLWVRKEPRELTEPYVLGWRITNHRKYEADFRTSHLCVYNSYDLVSPVPRFLVRCGRFCKLF